MPISFAEKNIHFLKLRGSQVNKGKAATKANFPCKRNLQCLTVGRGGALVEPMPFDWRIMGSNPVLATTLIS